MIRFRIVERPPQYGELRVRQVVRPKTALTPPQSFARVRGRDSIVRVAHVLRAHGIDPVAAEGGRYPALDRAREPSHRRRRRVVCFRVGARRTRRAPSVRLTAEPLRRRSTIHVLRPFGRTRSPNPGTALSHSAASRPSAGRNASAHCMMIFGFFVMYRPLPFVSLVAVAPWMPHCGVTPRTRRVTGLDSAVRRVGRAVLKRRTGCKPSFPFGFQRIVDAGMNCCLSTPEAARIHTGRTGDAFNSESALVVRTCALAATNTAAVLPEIWDSPEQLRGNQHPARVWRRLSCKSTRPNANDCKL